LLELDIRLGLEQGIETCAACEVFRVDHHDTKAGALHVAGGGLEHFSLRVVYDNRALALRPVQDIRNDIAAGLPRSYASYHADVLEAVSFAQSPALPVDEKARVAISQKAAQLTAAQIPRSLLFPASGNYQRGEPFSGLAHGSDHVSRVHVHAVLVGFLVAQASSGLSSGCP